MLYVPSQGNTIGLTTMSQGTTRPAANFGTAVTPAVGSYGSYAQIGSDLTDDCYGFWININSNSASTASRNTTVNIGIDEAGGTSFTTRISHLIVGGLASYTGNAGGSWQFFPLFIPSGSAVAVQAQSTVTTNIRVQMRFRHRPADPSAMRCASFVETIGGVAATGTAVTPGSTNKGTWTSLGTTTLNTWWWNFAIQIISTDTSWNTAAHHFDLGVGSAGNMVILADSYFSKLSSEQLGGIVPTHSAEWNVPAGSTIYVRGQSSGTPESGYYVAAYGSGG